MSFVLDPPAVGVLLDASPEDRPLPAAPSSPEALDCALLRLAAGDDVPTHVRDWLYSLASSATNLNT